MRNLEAIIYPWLYAIPLVFKKSAEIFTFYALKVKSSPLPSPQKRALGLHQLQFYACLIAR